MKTKLAVLLALYTPFCFSQNNSLLNDSEQMLIARSMKPAPIHQDNDREGEDDRGILQDAKNGDPLAQNAYGMIQYQKGNYQKAAFWWLKAANNGHQNAQYELGKMYRDGKGIERDYAKAYTLFMLSADHGYAPAIKAKNQMDRYITPGQKQLAYKWYRQQKRR